MNKEQEESFLNVLNSNNNEQEKYKQLNYLYASAIKTINEKYPNIKQEVESFWKQELDIANLKISASTQIISEYDKKPRMTVDDFKEKYPSLKEKIGQIDNEKQGKNILANQINLERYIELIIDKAISGGTITNETGEILKNNYEKIKTAKLQDQISMADDQTTNLILFAFTQYFISELKNDAACRAELVTLLQFQGTKEFTDMQNKYNGTFKPEEKYNYYDLAQALFTSITNNQTYLTAKNNINILQYNSKRAKFYQEYPEHFIVENLGYKEITGYTKQNEKNILIHNSINQNSMTPEILESITIERITETLKNSYEIEINKN